MKKKSIITLLIFGICLLVSMTFINSYYTNINKYFQDGRNSDGYSGYAFERNSNEFVTNGCGSGTMLDTLTGLCWEKNLSSGGLKMWANSTGYSRPTWSNSTKNYTYPNGKANYPVFSYCDDLSVGGNNDWRVPSVMELKSLIDQTGGSGVTCSTLQGFGFTNCQSNWYWANSVYSNDAQYAMLSSLSGNGDGISWGGKSTASYYLVCVRSDY